MEKPMASKKALHWGDEDITTWTDEALRDLFEMYRPVWERFMPEIEALQAEFKRRGIS